MPKKRAAAASKSSAKNKSGGKGGKAKAGTSSTTRNTRNRKTPTPPPPPPPPIDDSTSEFEEDEIVAGSSEDEDLVDDNAVITDSEDDSMDVEGESAAVEREMREDDLDAQGPGFGRGAVESNSDDEEEDEEIMGPTHFTGAELRSARPPHSEDEDEDEDDDSSQEDLTEEEEPKQKGRKGASTPASKRFPVDLYGPVTPPSPFEAPLERLGLADADEDEQEEEEARQRMEKRRKRRKPGIVYLSCIPPGYNVSQTTMFFTQFGQVGRVFLQPANKDKSSKSHGGLNKDKRVLRFTEGWIEFMSKRLAKEVAQRVNNTAVGGSKRSKAHDALWNIKYLPRFKWSHLTERLAYEKAVHQQKMRNEISQAKREAEFFKSNVEKAKRNKKSKKSNATSAAEGSETRKYAFRQKETDEEIRSKKQQESGANARKQGKKSKKNPGEDCSPPAAKQPRIDGAATAAASAEMPKASKSRSKRKRSGDRSALLSSVFV